jgi:tRNA (cmo5U34)-methyltransferase
MKDELFRQLGSGQKPFEFNAQVASVFDDMVSRSVPFYNDVLRMSAELAQTFYQPHTKIYDLGCSTGALVPHLQKEFADSTFNYVGLDSSAEMIDRANTAFRAQRPATSMSVRYDTADITKVKFEPASVVVSNYTFQFLKPLARQTMLRRIADALTPGGCLIVSEKCLEDSADMSRVFADRYHLMKERNGYSKLEIAEKRDALENVLIPFRVSENIEMLHEAGFSPVSIFFKCFNFVSFIALKP